jgi:hypothetical protein
MNLVRSLTKYLPKNARRKVNQIVRGLPANRLEMIRSERAKLQTSRKSSFPLESLLAEERKKREVVEAELEQNKEFYEAARNAGEALAKLEEAKYTALYVHYVGPVSKSGRFDESEKKTMERIAQKANVNSLLEERLGQVTQNLEETSEELDYARRKIFNTEIGEVTAPYESLPWIIYTPGGILKSSKCFNKRFEKKTQNLVYRLNKSNELHLRLARGEATSVEFEGGYLLFEPRVKDSSNTDSRTVATASYQPKGVIARWFSRNATDAVSTINKYLADINIGLMEADKTMGTKNGKE